MSQKLIKCWNMLQWVFSSKDMQSKTNMYVFTVGYTLSSDHQLAARGPHPARRMATDENIALLM